jgi:hypothetical protein
MLVVSIAEAVSLGIVEPPRQADVIAMEAHLRRASGLRGPIAASLPLANSLSAPDAGTPGRPDHGPATANAASFCLLRRAAYAA